MINKHADQVEPESVKALRECIELQIKKSQDYNDGGVSQATYYRRGLDTLIDLILSKIYRVISVSSNLKSGKDTNFESIEDSLQDLINYASFAIAWSRRKLPGQDPTKDLFNAPMSLTASSPTLSSEILIVQGPPSLRERPFMYMGKEGQEEQEEQKGDPSKFV